MIYYVIDKKEFYDAESAAEYVVDNYLISDDYDEMINECNGMINICGYEYEASEAFKNVDPIAYNCGYSDFEDSECQNIKYELERMDAGEVNEYYDYEVYAYYKPC